MLITAGRTTPHQIRLSRSRPAVGLIRLSTAGAPALQLGLSGLTAFILPVRIIIVAKLKVPLLSFGARGLLGAFDYVRRRGINILEKKPVVPDSRSPEQLEWRPMFSKCVDLWHLLGAAEKAVWESQARPRHMTGYAWFISQCLRPNPGIYLPLAGGTMQGAIDMNGEHIHGLPAPIHLQDPLRRQDYVDYIQPYLHVQGARVYHSETNGIPNDTATILAFNSERYDTDSIHDNVVSNSRLTCKTAGKYVMSLSTGWFHDPVGYRIGRIKLNATTYIAAYKLPVAADISWFMTFSTIHDLALNDFVEAEVEQNSGGILNIFASPQTSAEFMIQRIGS